MHLEPTTYTLSLPPDVFASLPESVQSYIRFLETSLQQLQIRVQELEARLAKNSSNSGKPPSSDGLKRLPKSERTRSGKKPGGQKGHIGKNLMRVESPDHVEIHTSMSCQGCGFNLNHVSGSCVEARQVFDIPKPVVEVTEHRAEEKKCPCCGCVSRGVFPEGVKAPVQYGERVQALAAYFSHQHFSYEQVMHGLCNAHHMREFTFIYEQEKEEWAKRMKDLLLVTNNRVEERRQQGFLPQEELLQIEQEYTQIITEGIAYHAQLLPLLKGKRGKQKQRDGKNFLDRLIKKRKCVLLFMCDFSVPFTNNLGERGMRMAKLKQKIGGCFRTLKGGRIFCRIRSYLETARKQGWNIWDALANALQGHPWLLPVSQQEQTTAT